MHRPCGPSSSALRSSRAPERPDVRPTDVSRRYHAANVATRRGALRPAGLFEGGGSSRRFGRVCNWVYAVPPPATAGPACWRGKLLGNPKVSPTTQHRAPIAARRLGVSNEQRVASVAGRFPLVVLALAGCGFRGNERGAMGRVEESSGSVHQWCNSGCQARLPGANAVKKSRPKA